MTFDRAVIGGIAVAMIAAIALIIWAVASGGASCPKGQRAVLLYEQPIITTVNGDTIVAMVPVFGCQS